jgi:MinD superfamily P-loop ATPase
MKEIVVISGKGGTGKTSIVASFAVLAENKVLADCDVDAADLHLVLEPRIQNRGAFSGSKKAAIRQEDCVACGACLARCRFDAVRMDGDQAGEATFTIDPIACEGCGVCVHFCPVDAIDFTEQVNGEWFVSETRCGPMVHARLGIAEENSGKLVSIVRDKARAIAKEKRCDYVIIDGPPGIGCPVIASMSGADIVVIVTEPTLSGAHDLERIADVAKHFNIPATVCINKYDINNTQADAIIENSKSRHLTVIGKIRYDEAVTKAQVAKKAVVENGDSPIVRNITSLWTHVVDVLRKGEKND